VRPRIPLAYAGLLIVALIAAVGFAAFSPSTQSVSDDALAPTITAPVSEEAMSARVASAVLALRVADAESRTATTQSNEATSSTQGASDVAAESPGIEEETVPLQTQPSENEPNTTVAASDTTGPSIRVTSPSDGDTVKRKTTTFRGTTTGTSVVSGPYEATVKADGTWSIILVLELGENGASFTTTDASGKTASTRIVVTYSPESTTTTHVDATAPHVDTTEPHVHTTEPHVDTTAPHVDATVPHDDTATTTSGSSGSNWSPNWPADSGGQRNIETWRSAVAKYWPENRVDCVLGIILRESRGNPRAYNTSANAEGLMQHLSKYWVSRARGAGFVDSAGRVASPYNGEANIAAGASLANYYASAVGQWWNPWKSGGGVFTANYGTCQSSNPS